jgi:uncharacterized membrane protein YedE/YeeE
MQIIATFVSGLLFGLGLCLSGLVNPAKVQSFLDIAGAWDPSLAITMATAVLITWAGYRIVFARRVPLFAGSFQIPPSSGVDARLIAGAAIFGVGWGLVGFCPGPAITALSLASWPAVVFVLAMLAGMGTARQLVAHRRSEMLRSARHLNS